MPSQLLRTQLLFAAASSGPSPYWYATRSLGLVALIVLTGTVVLGIVTTIRWTDEDTPGFVSADMHRNLSLIAITLVLLHIVTTVLDPFAGITVRDVLVPIGAKYRPVWLGLGVVAFEVMVAIIVTSLLRDRIGPRAWRVIHWGAYASWPLAVVHGMGTGSDSPSPWMIAVVVWAIVAVLVALFFRLRRGEPATLAIRLGAAATVGLALFIGGNWAFTGPLAPGWSAKAGTPVPSPSPSPTGPVHTGAFSDPLYGVVVVGKNGYLQISMRDTVDTELTVAIRSPNSNETLPVVTISRDTKVLCTVPAAVSDTLYAVCGTTRLTITLYGSSAVLKSGGNITGQLTTSGPLN